MLMADQKILNECPVCRGLIEVEPDAEYLKVFCRKCGANGPSRMTLDDAVDAFYERYRKMKGKHDA